MTIAGKLTISPAGRFDQAGAISLEIEPGGDLTPADGALIGTLLRAFADRIDPPAPELRHVRTIQVGDETMIDEGDAFEMGPL